MSIIGLIEERSSLQNIADGMAIDAKLEDWQEGDMEFIERLHAKMTEKIRPASAKQDEQEDMFKE